MKDETIAENMAPAAFSNVVDAVKSSLTTGDSGVRLAGVGLDGGALQKSVADAVESALSISVLDALLKGWHGVKSITDLTGREGPMDGKPRVAALAKHKLKVTHTPEIRLSLGEVADLRTVSVPVTLEVEASGVVLTVVDREVTKASAGTLEPKLTVKVEKVKVVETKLRRIELSGNLMARMPAEELEPSA
ncbi:MULTISPECIES: hypothetical protein [unclassified Roseovarius]|uniref:hypothetical protein n=1 Tax=unclassified Roseovarius TaxID=2614913 RepID=UPI00273FB4FA|nr:MULTISPECIES: hypothetical protein [unclassified Roseovarius]